MRTVVTMRTFDAEAEITVSSDISDPCTPVGICAGDTDHNQMIWLTPAHVEELQENLQFALERALQEAS